MNPPKMPIHIGDYKRDTGHLRAAQHGAYLMLLFHHWSTGELPDDDAQLAAIARLSPSEWRKARPILIKFFDEGWRHGRVEEDLAAAKQAYEKRAKAGEKGGKAKADGKQCSSIATAGPEQSHSNAVAGPEQPLTFNQSKKEDAPDGAPPTYAFESGVIRLNQRDLDRWKASFSHLDVPAELEGLSEWAGKQANWFHAVKGALAKRNRDVAAAAKKGGEFKWNGIEGVS